MERGWWKDSGRGDGEGVMGGGGRCPFTFSFLPWYSYPHTPTPSHPPTPTQVKVLYIRNLMLTTTEAQIEEVFSKFAPVERVKKIRDYAFVHFHSKEDAHCAMEAMNGRGDGGGWREGGGRAEREGGCGGGEKREGGKKAFVGYKRCIKSSS